MAKTITEGNVSSVIVEIGSAFLNIPFTESNYEIDTFYVNAQLTAERAFRAIGIRLEEDFNKLRAAQYTRDNLLVDIDELAAVIASEPADSFTQRRAILDTDKKDFELGQLAKTISDLLVEINILYAHFERFDLITRQQFEAAEPGYFIETLGRQFRGVTDDKAKLESTKIKYPALEKDKNKDKLK